jgi:putative oxygen-independent coproporphyrinogen III oxidase
MRNFTGSLPLSLYVHIPWCVRKCPYCDFNSHEAKNALPEDLYVAVLLQELDSHLHLIAGRPLVSIFFGGGTPSLFSGIAIATILEGVAKRLPFHPQIEITLEANPGTIDQSRFLEFREAGVNRLSLGVQSLQDEKLKTLGRIHDRHSAMNAITLAKQAGFTNFNLDMMYGLPNQSIDDALHDIETALTFGPTHFSWYQLTIEPNTLFHHQPPALPADDLIWIPKAFINMKCLRIRSRKKNAFTIAIIGSLVIT